MMFDTRIQPQTRAVTRDPAYGVEQIARHPLIPDGDVPTHG